jgi:phosphoglycolate phosphatase-like HAD superfamily hydrolase
MQMRIEVASFFNPPLNGDFTKVPISQLIEELRIQHPEKITKVYQRIEVLEEEASQKAEIIAGADRIILSLNKFGIKRAILTNNSRISVNKYIEKPAFRFLRDFYLITRDDISFMKPHPAGLEKILVTFQEQDKKITKDSTAYIGDSYIDAKAAYDAGIRFIWFNSRNIDASVFPSKPFAELKEWAALEKLLRETNIECIF